VQNRGDALKAENSGGNSIDSKQAKILAADDVPNKHSPVGETGVSPDIREEISPIGEAGINARKPGGSTKMTVVD